LFKRGERVQLRLSVGERICVSLKQVLECWVKSVVLNLNQLLHGTCGNFWRHFFGCHQWEVGEGDLALNVQQYIKQLAQQRIIQSKMS
jgi:hypothetical protein